MRRSRHVLAAVVVATALCADRVATAAPQARPQVAEFARSLAARLTVGFRRVVPQIRFVADRRDGESNPTVRPAAEVASPGVGHASAASPFRFRLPPPAL